MAYNAFFAYTALPRTSLKSVSFENLRDQKAVRLLFTLKFVCFLWLLEKLQAVTRVVYFRYMWLVNLNTSIQFSAILIEDVKC